MINNNGEFKKLTRGTRDIVKNTINETKAVNRHELCGIIAENLEKKFKGDTLNYQLSRMNLETTGDILDAIDTYMFKHFKQTDLEENKAKLKENK